MLQNPLPKVKDIEYIVWINSRIEITTILRKSGGDNL